MTADPTIRERALELVESTEGELRRLTREANLADWEAATTGTEEAQARAAETEGRLKKYLGSRARYEEITRCLESSEVDDARLRRRLQLLALEHRPNLLPEPVIEDLVRRSKAIQAEFYVFRAKIDGREVTNNEITRILRSERDEALRRATWEGSKQIAPRVAGPLIELVRERNEAARSLGYSDYYAMQIDLQEIDERELSAVLDELKRRTDTPFAVAKAEIDRQLAERYGMDPSAPLYPWHYEDPFFQEPPLSEQLGLDRLFKGRDLVAIARAFYRDVGLPVDDILDRSDLHERPGKDQHAFCTDIDREGDVRILCNMKDDERWMGTLMHELGHAVYDKFIPADLPWGLRQPAHIAATEAIAMFMDRLVYDVDWLEGVLETDIDDRTGLGARAGNAQRFEMLLLTRWVLVMTRFERALYADPERDDLADHWWDLVEELQRVRRPPGRKQPDWAAKIHFAVAPVYYHNYLLGELIASQLAGAIQREALDGRTSGGYVRRAELGEFLSSHFFASGASLQWQDLLEESTGSRLSAGPFVEEFVG